MSLLRRFGPRHEVGERGAQGGGSDRFAHMNDTPLGGALLHGAGPVGGDQEGRDGAAGLRPQPIDHRKPVFAPEMIIGHDDAD